MIERLDVTKLEPKMKHPTIFERFDALNEESAFVILNDHDPKPLYYQMIAERGPVFKWEYLEEGPEWWQVRITKRTTNKEETLGELAAKDLRKVEVFRKYGLDFCCGGKKTLSEACAEKGLDTLRIREELEQDTQDPSPAALNVDDWGLSFLIDYILNTHHAYVRKTLPEMLAFAAKVDKVHGSQHSELQAVHERCTALAKELESHMVKEERILFPYVKQLETGITEVARHFSSVGDPIHVMEMEHETAGEHLAEIRKLTQDYHLPPDACASYATLYRMLEDFERDLHMHVHLENNILFPKALELERSRSVESN